METMRGFVFAGGGGGAHFTLPPPPVHLFKYLKKALSYGLETFWQFK